MWTKGESVIDYVVVGEETVEEMIKKLEIGDRIDLDYHPVVIWMKGGSKEK